MKKEGKSIIFILILFLIGILVLSVYLTVGEENTINNQDKCIKFNKDFDQKKCEDDFAKLGKYKQIEIKFIGI